MHIDNIYKTIQFCQLWMLWTSQDTTNSPALKVQVPSPSVWAPGAALAALQAQLVPRTVWSRLLQRAHHYHRRRAVAWAETLGGAGSGGHLAAFACGKPVLCLEGPVAQQGTEETYS